MTFQRVPVFEALSCPERHALMMVTRERRAIAAASGAVSGLGISE